MTARQEHVGASIKRLRHRRGVTGEAVASAVGTTRTHLCAIETGRVEGPRYTLLRTLADYFEVTLSELVGEVPATNAGLSPEAAQIAHWYDHELSDQSREVIFGVIQLFVRRKPPRTESEDQD